MDRFGKSGRPFVGDSYHVVASKLFDVFIEEVNKQQMVPEPAETISFDQLPHGYKQAWQKVAEFALNEVQYISEALRNG